MDAEVISDSRQIESLFRADAAGDPAPAVKPAPRLVPVASEAQLRTRPATFPIEIDGELPVIVLFQALAAYGITVKNNRGRLVLTQHPENFT